MLCPNSKQKTKLFQYAGAARFAYNWALGREQENDKNGGKFISEKELRKEFTQLKKTEEYAWLNNISNNVTKQAIKDAVEAYKKFFEGYAKFPQFKSKKHSVPKFYQDNVKIKFTDTHVKLVSSRSPSAHLTVRRRHESLRFAQRRLLVEGFTYAVSAKLSYY